MHLLTDLNPKLYKYRMSCFMVEAHDLCLSPPKRMLQKWIAVLKGCSSAQMCEKPTESHG